MASELLETVSSPTTDNPPEPTETLPVATANSPLPTVDLSISKDVINPQVISVESPVQQTSQTEVQVSATDVSVSPTVMSPTADDAMSPVIQESPVERYESPEDMHESQTEVNESQTDTTNSQSERGKKPRRRGTAWTDDQTDFLMEVWARHTDSTGTEEYAITNAPIYRIISKSMGELGYLDKTSDQCKTRIHTLKRAYKLTKAEIDAGAINITFCRHYDKLKIIMGDDPSTTPKQLAEILAERRRQKKLHGVDSEAKPKKIKISSEIKVKRTLDQASLDKSQPAVLPKQPHKEIAQVPLVPHVPPLPAVSSLWNSQAYTFPFSAPPAPNLTYPETHYVSAPLTNHTPSYPNTAVTTEPAVSPSISYDINHNTNVVIKQEKTEPDCYSVFQAPYVAKTADSVTQTKEEIERMRLDLEMKKIEMERNRLEMEERQRREDRDHQYRMMQLLLVGLGHNPGAGSLGQGTDTEEAHQPELSRALEGGLVPGGAQSANEKGLSFSEI